MWFSFKSNRPFDYIRSFVGLAQYSVQAAEYLAKSLNHLVLENMAVMLVELHEIEHQADVSKDFMVNKLTREFLPPFDKDDIMVLAHQIDAVTDAIEEVLIFIDVHQIRDVPPQAKHFAAMIVSGCKSMHMALAEMKDYKNSSKLNGYLAEVNRLKKEGKELHGQSVKKIHESRQDPVAVINYSGLFTCLERCTYNCKEVTNTIERMVIHYS